MPDDADMIRIAREIDELDDPKFTGHNMNPTIGTAMARVVRKVMTTDESMKPEIDAAKRSLRGIDARIDAKVREYRMRFVRYMTTDESTQKFDGRPEEVE